MASRNNKKKQTQQKAPKMKLPPVPKGRMVTPVSMVTNAPLQLGNTVRGVAPKVTHINDGVRVAGRDFIFSASNVNGAANWTLCGGLPITPAAMFGSNLKQFSNMYASYRFVDIAFHFITAEPATQLGNIMFYIQKSRSDPMIPWGSNSSFLPFVLSDPSTVMGPVWMNHTAYYKPEPRWRSTDYLLGDDLDDEAAGDVFLFVNSPVNTTPGYVMMDYTIEFKELSANPKRNLLPLQRTAWVNTSLGLNAANVTSGSTAVALGIFGNDLTGQAAVAPVGISLGDIYKVVIDSDHTSYGGATSSNLLQLKYPSGQGVAITNGFTCYALVDVTTPRFSLFPSISFARAGVNNFVFGLTNGSLTFNLMVWVSLIDGTEVQSSI